MSKFILIDHSMKDLSGHHYEYAVRVLRAAQEDGQEPILAVHREFQKQATDPWPVYPVYRYGFWASREKHGLIRAVENTWGAVQRWLYGVKARWTYSCLGIWWEIRSQPIGQVMRQLRESSNSYLLLAAIILIYYATKILAATASLFALLLPFQDYFRRIGHGLLGFVRAVFSPVLLLVRYKEWLLGLRSEARMAKAFAEATQQLFQELPLQPGDLVFIPTLAETELLGLLKYFQKDPASRHTQWHLVFRRNIYVGREPDYATQEESLRPLRNAFRAFRDGLTGQQVYFYTDTKCLTGQYNRQGAAVFQTLPIPVSPEYRRLPEQWLPGKPLHIIYVGDARGEKGYHYLPHLIGDLWTDYVATGKVVFTLQSNFSIPGGEPSSAVARAQLECYPRDKVRLLTEPLTTTQYRDLVLSGDLALVLYDRDNYYARSSGIFVEAMVAGMPVVAPTGSWMANQLAGTVYQYHDNLRRSVPIVKSRTGLELRWRIHGAPEINPMNDGQVALAGQTPRYCWLSPPQEATYLLISFRVLSDLQGLYTIVHADQRNRDDSPLGAFSAHLGGGDAPCSAVIPLHQGVRKIWLGFRGAYSAHPIRLADLQIDFLRTVGPLPVSTVGAFYTYAEEISTCVREMVAHFDHYRSTAHAFSKEWSAYHNPNCLVEHLTKWKPDEGPQVHALHGLSRKRHQARSVILPTKEVSS